MLACKIYTLILFNLLGFPRKDVIIDSLTMAVSSDINAAKATLETKTAELQGLINANIALDAATKAAEVEVAYGRSFYAGAANASTPHAGEVIGILAGKTPGAVKSGMEAALAALERTGFEEVNTVPYLAHTVASVGSFLAKEAGVPVGSAIAYLIAPPLESMYALDFALKAADVRLCRLYAPPSETNFGGALLSGTQSACAAACEAFANAVADTARKPVEN